LFSAIKLQYALHPFELAQEAKAPRSLSITDLLNIFYIPSSPKLDGKWEKKKELIVGIIVGSQQQV